MNKEILEFITTIPKNKVVSYKYIADKFWVHPTKVSSVMRYNQDPIKYPCYKVLANNWNISWYNTIRWVQEKIEKLNNDWIEVINWKVNNKYFLQ